MTMTERGTLLSDIVDRLKAYEPESVILFGSWARGRERSDSDVDLAIVKRTRRRMSERISEVLELLYPGTRVDRWPQYGIDVVVYTPDELRERLSMGDWFVEDIIRKGWVLYGKKPLQAR